MTVRLIDTTTIPTETRAALESLRDTVVFSSNDWSTAPDFAWIYGILVGWTDDDGNNTVGRFAERFGWDAAKVNRLLLHRAAVVASMEEK
jgi:hypothetical protein